MKKKPRTKPKDSKFKGFFKKASNIGKVQEEDLKRKKALKEQNKKQQLVPYGYKAKRTGIIVFWCLFGLVLCFTFVNMFSKKSGSANEENVINQSVATVEGVSFAEDFLYTYLNYSETDDLQAKGKSLQYFLESKLNTDVLTRTYDKTELKTDRNDIKLVESKFVTEKNTLYTFQTDITYLNKESNNVVEEQVENVLVKDDEVVVATGTFTSTKYIQVSVYYDDSLNRYTIVSYPSFVGVDKTSRVANSEGNVTSELKKAESTVTERVKVFLPTFFKSYTSDSNEQLSYILKDKNATTLLGSGLVVAEIESPVVYKGSEGKEYVAQVNVQMEDEQSKVKHTATYYLVLIEEENTFYVSKLNDLEYIRNIGKPSETTNTDETKSVDTKSVETETVDTETIDTEK